MTRIKKKKKNASSTCIKARHTLQIHVKDNSFIVGYSKFWKCGIWVYIKII